LLEFAREQIKFLEFFDLFLQLRQRLVEIVPYVLNILGLDVHQLVLGDGEFVLNFLNILLKHPAFVLKLFFELVRLAKLVIELVNFDIGVHNGLLGVVSLLLTHFQD
jgi:hypothetical protein